jgi:hypothetical protein
MSRGHRFLRQAVAHAVQGEHLILYTREHEVPRMERALAEIQAGIENGPRPLPCDLSARRAQPFPLSTMSGEKNR